MRILVIINASSGKGHGNNIIPVIEERFGSSLIGIRQTMSSREAESIARKACREGVDIIATVGGDGTINGVLNGIIGSDISLGIIPVGVANDLALHLGIPRNVEKACDIIFAGNKRKVDVICANGRHYLTCVGLGLPYHVLAVAEFIKRRKIAKRFFARFGGCGVYIIGLPFAFIRALPRRNHVRIHSHHFSINANALSLLISNLPVLGGKYHILPAAVNDDGLGDVFLIKNSGHPLRLITTILKIFKGSHLDMPDVIAFKNRDVTVECFRPTPFFGDGEIAPPDTRFEISIKRRAVRVIVPIEERRD